MTMKMTLHVPMHQICEWQRPGHLLQAEVVRESGLGSDRCASGTIGDQNTAFVYYEKRIRRMNARNSTYLNFCTVYPSKFLFLRQNSIAV